jgi:acetyl-CoA acetyltransferase
MANRTPSVIGVSERLGKRTGASALELHVSVGRDALLDANLGLGDVDGIVTGSPMLEGSSAYAARVAETLGLMPVAVANSLDLGGATACAAVHLAGLLIEQAVCSTVLVIYADNRLSAMTVSPVTRLAEEIDPVYEQPTGATVPAMYAMAAHRHMNCHGSTPDEWAVIAVQARLNAARTPGALRTETLTVKDVLNSPPVAWPLRAADCCLVSDFAGALVITTQDRAMAAPHRPVTVLGSGQAHGHNYISEAPDLLDGAAGVAARQAFGRAGLQPADVDVAQLYDCFTIAVVLELEQAGFCAPGEGAAYAASGALAPDGQLPFNTNGGMLSFHNGGIYHVTEAVHQLRGAAGQRQVRDAEVAYVHGNGGFLSHHAALVLGRSR